MIDRTGTPAPRAGIAGVDPSRPSSDGAGTSPPPVGSPASADPRGDLPWFRRISVRLAGTLAGLSLVAYFAFPKVHSFALQLFGLPGLQQSLVRMDPLEFGRNAFLVGAQQEGPGRWVPTLDRSSALTELLSGRGSGFVWIDADRRLVEHSPGLALPMPEGGTPAAELAWDLEEDLLDGPPTRPLDRSPTALGRVEVELWWEGEFAGWLLFLPLALDPASEGGYVESEELEATRAVSARVLNVASIAFLAVLSLAISWMLSRLVTGRVTRLSELADAVPTGPEDLPGPFDDDGDDEIARLARAMNAMRSRVLGLLEDLRESDRARRHWIARVSHDLRTPLTALFASLERAAEDLRAGRTQGLDDQLEVARLDAQRLNELAEDLLDVARLDAEETQVREPVPPGELVRHAVRALKNLAARSRVALSAEVEPRLPELAADGRRLMRAVENLLRNALQHARTKVVVRARAVRGEGGRACVRFEVEDDGPGLPTAEDGGEIWQTLAQRLSRPDSAGLGLVVVRKVAELHGGRAGAGNREEGGARLWFEVPAGGDGE